ncbi:MAG TPA: ABC transporter permease [Candidatus Methylomirabilis sp.]|nr:ABC transporter permease [Candidatus Methylomirabilis sp.]
MNGSLHQTWLRIKALFKRKELERDLDEELKFHLAMREEKHRAEGIAPQEARYAARKQFGNRTNWKESTREMWTFVSLESLWQDVRYATRMLRKNLAFTSVAVLTLALGIGANTAIFSVINGVLLSPLPYKDPQQLIAATENDSLMNIIDIQRQTRAFAQGGGINTAQMDYTSGPEPLQIKAGFVDAGLLETLGVPPMLGRVISREEDVKGGPRVIVASYSFWQHFLDSDPNAVGKVITLSGFDYTVIGVMPSGFTPPREHPDIYVSLWVAYPEAAPYRGVHFMRNYWRLKPGVTLAQAQEDMFAIDGRLAEQYPDNEKTRRTLIVPLREIMVGDVRAALLILFGAVGFVLLIACANFAGLLVARNVARRHELVVRASLGAGRIRLIRQALVESSLLAIIGGAAGLLLAIWGTRLLLSFKPAALARFTGISLDARVLLFVFGVSLLTGIVFGIAPAWSASRTDFAESLKEGGRGATAGPSGHLLRKWLVATEFALALVLLVGAGLLIRGFSHLRSVNPGFNPHNIMTMYLQLPATRYAEIPRQTQFRRELLSRLNSLPGVEAAMITDIPLGDNYLSHTVVFDGRPPVPVGTEPHVQTLSVMGDFFRVLQIPIRAGRGLTDMDREGQPLVAVVNEEFVRRFFPHENPLGARIDWARSKTQRWMTIVGVAHDVKHSGLDQPADPSIYAPYSQSDEAWRRWMTLALRTVGPSPGLVDDVKKQVWSLDRQIPVSQVQSMDDILAVSLAQQRFNMLLLGLFAALALILAAVGIYGLMSYAVSQRTHEIGVRVAVGAQRLDVLGLVLADGAKLALLGIAFGVAAALVLTRLMASLLFEVTPTDPATFASVAILLALVGLAACYIPARRATRVDPIVALRYE